MVVFLVIGILSAMTWPVLIRQVAKAKETEGIKMLSNVGYLQQAYFFEHQQFAPDYSSLGVNPNGNYFDLLPLNTPVGGNYSTSQAVTRSGGLDASRNYSQGVYYNNGSYEIILCQSSTPGGAVSAPSSSLGSCSGGVQIN
ncbi:Type II secretion envelope pseudopilin protein (PulG,guides folded protein to PulD in outer membrane) [Synechocystis sp. PCC 6714]|nr:Type II secretion envelope pseudopilin protein (PulG,guides folded protein to PulD in outer membrane) [Synechocystis sp. PCC 6714]